MNTQNASLSYHKAGAFVLSCVGQAGVGSEAARSGRALERMFYRWTASRPDDGQTAASRRSLPCTARTITGSGRTACSSAGIRAAAPAPAATAPTAAASAASSSTGRRTSLPADGQATLALRRPGDRPGSGGSGPAPRASTAAGSACRTPGKLIMLSGRQSLRTGATPRLSRPRTRPPFQRANCPGGALTASGGFRQPLRNESTATPSGVSPLLAGPLAVRTTGQVSAAISPTEMVAR